MNEADCAAMYVVTNALPVGNGEKKCAISSYPVGYSALFSPINFATLSNAELRTVASPSDRAKRSTAARAASRIVPPHCAPNSRPCSRIAARMARDIFLAGLELDSVRASRSCVFVVEMFGQSINGGRTSRGSTESTVITYACLYRAR